MGEGEETGRERCKEANGMLQYPPPAPSRGLDNDHFNRPRVEATFEVKSPIQYLGEHISNMMLKMSATFLKFTQHCIIVGSVVSTKYLVCLGIVCMILRWGQFKFVLMCFKLCLKCFLPSDLQFLCQSMSGVAKERAGTMHSRVPLKYNSCTFHNWKLCLLEMPSIHSQPHPLPHTNLYIDGI